MKFLRVKNLHCIIDTSEIPLKGINLLLGANSAGKSSFLRVLPLIRQSLDYNKKGPFLWFGERVDFGSFSEAQRKGSEDLTISFGLDVNLNDYVGSRKSPTVSGEFEFVVDSMAHNDYLKGFSFKSAQISVEMGFTSGGRIKRLVVNGKDYSFLSNRILVPTYYHMIPRVRFVNSVRSRKNTQRFIIKESAKHKPIEVSSVHCPGNNWKAPPGPLPISLKVISSYFTGSNSNLCPIESAIAIPKIDPIEPLSKIFNFSSIFFDLMKLLNKL